MSIEERLERQNQWMRRIGAAAVVLLAVVLLGPRREGLPPGLEVMDLDTFTVGQLVIKGETGRIGLRVVESTLTLFDANGKVIWQAPKN